MLVLPLSDIQMYYNLCEANRPLARANSLYVYILTESRTLLKQGVLPKSGRGTLQGWIVRRLTLIRLSDD